VIVAVSFPGDPHAQRVVELLDEAGHEVHLLDLSELPDRATLTVDYDHGSPRIEIGRDAAPAIDLARASAVWWRRPQAVEPSSVADPEIRLFTVNEWQEAINGLWQLLDVHWVNDPVRDEVAARKALQLRIAAEIGLHVPRTVITSDPEQARAFVEAEGVGRTVFKTFSCTHAIWRETRLIGEDAFSALDAVRLAPVIFQEYVAGDVDLRVTVVGRKLFPAAIHSQDTDYPVDFRMSLGQARTEPTTLPAEVERLLLRLMAKLGLEYGAIDLRRTPAGDYVFFEVNTAGEFLFVEERTGQPIAQTLAELLATPCGRGRGSGSPHRRRPADRRRL
jgi:glutathione synthase/RimK-type ligase-like ATP-grasp enzyme